MTPTIKDVARRAGISYATVSRALNGKYGVSEETREKILRIAREMNYRPNAIAQGLVNRSTKTVGLVIPDITSPFFPRVALGVEDTMLEAGYSVFLCNTNWNLEREKACLDQLARNQVDGILVSSVAAQAREVEKRMAPGMPLVYLSSYPEGTARSYVRVDNVLGADMAVSHLISRGRRKIIFIGSVQEPYSLEDRLEGFRKALQNGGIAPRDTMIHLGEFREDSGYSIIQGILKSGERPDGIFAENDLIAMGVVSGIRDLGFRVPEDISVIGFDDISIASYRDVQLSTIHQPRYRIGRAAAEIMLEQLARDAREWTTQHKVLEPELVIRGSS